jgi:hypothetical protein
MSHTKSRFDDLQASRHDFHRHPELGFEEGHGDFTGMEVDRAYDDFFKQKIDPGSLKAGNSM